MTLKYIGIKLVEAWPQAVGHVGSQQEGYAVKYPDGYMSWSPKATFEAAYIPVHSDYNVTVDIKTESCLVPAKQSQ